MRGGSLKEPEGRHTEDATGREPHAAQQPANDLRTHGPRGHWSPSRPDSRSAPAAPFHVARPEADPRNPRAPRRVVCTSQCEAEGWQAPSTGLMGKFLQAAPAPSVLPSPRVHIKEWDVEDIILRDLSPSRTQAP